MLEPEMFFMDEFIIFAYYLFNNYVNKSYLIFILCIKEMNNHDQFR